MLWLGIDFETTGLDTEKDRVVEVGAVAWDWDAMQPVDIYNTLVFQDVPISAEASAVNGITKEMCDKWGVNECVAMTKLQNMLSVADYVVAHNAPFDQGMFDSFLERERLKAQPGRWLDSSVDVPYPKHFKQRNLLYVSAMYEFINPFPHRAVTDVLAMFKVLSKFDPVKIIEYSQAPNITLRAMVKKPWNDDGVSVGWAKSLGYRWEQANKVWVKIVKDFEVDEETKLAKDLGFQAIQIKGEGNE